ncbi:MAG: 50S ribosomal protein L18 [Mycoplasmataceae bacterium]|jgi:large subunit ribosomal protein L18|nr:50S ribosomal protein L18 [Mycoplasmataceae bacterium]
MAKKTSINRKQRTQLRHKRITNRLKQTANSKLRLVVSKSNKHLIAQIIDDTKGHTIICCSSKQMKKHANIAIAKQIGVDIAKKAIEKNIKEVAFDRGGNKYHGQIKALADAVREQGIKF